MRHSILLASAVFIVACTRTSAPVSTTPVPDQALLPEIRGMDDSLSAAFNAHDANGLMSLFARDLEFYHDTQGLQNFEAVIAGFRALFASSDIRRERVGSLEVYRVRGYGAIEVGTHRFCHTEASWQDGGTFKFVQLWRRDANGWIIARVVSYGH
jgi:ketosteroid isomerase-like protein